MIVSISFSCVSIYVNTCALQFRRILGLQLSHSMLLIFDMKDVIFCHIARFDDDALLKIVFNEIHDESHFINLPYTIISW